MRLSKITIENATYSGDIYEGSDGRKKWERQVLWDDEVRGLGVRLLPTGRKMFILSYRTGNRKRQMTLGEFGVLTLQQARKRAIRELGDVLEGQDPLAEREKRRQGTTIRKVAARYLEEHAIPKKKSRSAAEDRRLLEKSVLPTLGSRDIADITRKDISLLHHSLRKTPTQANRVLALVSVIMSLAEKWGLRPDNSNPCRHVERFPEKGRERFLSEDEISRLGRALTEAEQTPSEPLEAIAAIRLLLLTGCRRDEILTLKWEFVDFRRGVLWLPDSKTGAKMIPLGAAALELLEALPRHVGNPHVLPGRNGNGRLVGLHRPWARLRAKAGLPDVRLHDLRHSFASVGAGSGLNLPILGKLLGHRTAATTARYSHLADDPLRRAAEQISSVIAAGLNN